MKNIPSYFVVVVMMVASTIASAGAVYKCASGNGSFVYQDKPCLGGSAIAAPMNTAGTSGAAASSQIPPQCLGRVGAKPAENMALQLERMKVLSRMRAFTLTIGAPAPDDDPVKRDKCEGIVARYDSLLEELNHSDLDDLKMLAQCFISQTNSLYAEHAQLRCDL